VSAKVEFFAQLLFPKQSYIFQGDKNFMRLAKKFLWAGFFLLPLLFLNAGNAFGVVVDDYTPDVTARVARISFVRGDVQIKRGGDDKQDWERATLNLPLVEGDELSTGANTVVEIQLDSYNHLRLSENAYLKFTTLRDEGIAASLPQGTMSMRFLNFDKSKSYFEVDAPTTTFSVERAGLFRIDAGDTRNSEIRVTAAENGEAKVYTKTSGFTLRSGRSAQIYIEGNYAGDYETGNISRTIDEFDDWVLQRDAVIAKRLKDASYDKYYDRDIYGAEDLSEYGEWIYTKKYGYVWKPYTNSVAGYSNWSPYRYGHWRWVPVFGWTWVNDEPWGWATYHHGRWVWDNGDWAWTPYGYYRSSRSWWSPAIVSITTWNGSTICWYPLGYDDYYYDYNRGYRRNGRYNNNTTIINNNTTVIVVNPTPNPSPTPPVLSPEQINAQRALNSRTPTFQRIPANAVVSVSAEEFGKETRGYQTAPLETAKVVLSKKIEENQTPPILPNYEQVKGKISKQILIENPRDDRSEREVKTGATQRENGKSLDQQLEKERIFGNRQKVTEETRTNGNVDSGSTETRKTGAVTRPPVIKQDDETKRTPDWNPRTPGGNTNNDEERKKERKTVVRQKEDEETRTPPIIEQRREEEKRRQEEKRREPPREEKRQEEPRREEPKREEPKREERREEPKREEPRQEKPPQPTVNRKEEKDG
jgi:hypothetical protein